ncbi:exodeoxyribonuclease VII small subunit [Corynebacterium sp. MC-04]|uniref:Exodeoxyribonuclease 7 small subunit n=1 Tax=Corynebacterium parakroppenstedtii TaxID=2828363 RepID=A0ABS9HM11_9CORY|nr:MULTISPECIES: exodeoxyribonuclease VII small subunit [Corynebacterium]MDU3198109.1 exodeoxyribonuclease VII small subunit [Corynebacterium kroppenstedtii]MBY0789009.1 exodeoxyribonuclease VII small subunit [Corynebacterium parakroppenstedtii]MBY0793072.1 exodeoxyribonuclease VII small subunit [Corynebacterium parakroppenstedtii]MBY0795623.1 exodeoxyribonuclease VII small subunit [Corynebacterium parakroppenstedtii]MBY0797686.1 exodeoxyribonuclease VII small subunit [Corynebacterium parakrop
MTQPDRNNDSDSFTIGSGESNPRFKPVEELSYEEARQELIEVVRILELGQMSLDESLLYWERGEALARTCEDYLEGARHRVEKALKDSDYAEGEDDSSDGADSPADGSDFAS